ncbi:MAG TPA: TIR domain-containing protein [Solirubrobacterales bacterium]|nr:TIR domain-containing protein [Solirubrobacterales bacterium]
MPELFLSHASEDKDFARSLYEALEERGVAVWFDETALHPGDSLTECIDAGLARCRFGVVVFSRSFFERAWTREELRGLRTRQLAGEDVLIPLWHGVGVDEVRTFSPPMADLLGIPTTIGTAQVADRILARLNGTSPADVVRRHDPDFDPRVRAHLAQVKDLAPTVLVDRERELRDLAVFCAGEDPYLHLVGGAWAGKTALVSWFSLSPPEGVDVVSFFVNAGLAGQRDSGGFTDGLIAQLGPLAGEPHRLPPGAPWAERDGERRRLLDRAATRATESGRRLLLLVDGLDEDQGIDSAFDLPSIASLLPRHEVPGLLVAVTSRPHPELPIDLPQDHPLRTKASRVDLPASPHAADLAALAKQELFRQLREPGAEVDVIGLLCAAGDGLSIEELAELTEEPRFILTSKIESALGRSLAAWHAPGRAEPAFSLAHEALREEAMRLLADRLPGYRSRIHAWAERQAKAKWPAETPYYLLWSYWKQLIAQRDHTRLQALALDPHRMRRMAEEVGGSARVFAEIKAAEHLATEDGIPDLGVLARLAAQRARLLSHTHSLPSHLPALLARFGDVENAEQAAYTMSNVDAALASLAIELRRQDRLGAAERLALRISNSRLRSTTAAPLALRFIEEGRAEEAEALDPHIEDHERQPLAAAYAQQGQWERSEQLANSIGRGIGRDRTFRSISHIAGEAGAVEVAAQLVAQIENAWHKADALLSLARQTIDVDPAASADWARAAAAALAEVNLSFGNDKILIDLIRFLWRAGLQEEARRLALQASNQSAAAEIAHLLAEENPAAARDWARGLPGEEAIACLMILIAFVPAAEGLAIAAETEDLISRLPTPDERAIKYPALAAAVAPIDLDRSIEILDKEKWGEEDPRLLEAQQLLDDVEEFDADDKGGSAESLFNALARTARRHLGSRGWRVPSRLNREEGDSRRIELARAAGKVLATASPSRSRNQLLSRLANLYVDLEQWDGLDEALAQLEAAGQPAGNPVYREFGRANRSTADIAAVAKRLWAQPRMGTEAGAEDLGDLLDSYSDPDDFELSVLRFACGGEWDAAEAAVERLRWRHGRYGCLDDLSHWSALAGRWSEALRFARSLSDSREEAGALLAICRIATEAGEHRVAEQVSCSLAGISRDRALAAIAQAAMWRGESPRAERALAEIDDEHKRAETLVTMAAAAVGDEQAAADWAQRAIELAERLPGEVWRAETAISLVAAPFSDPLQAEATTALAARLCRRIVDRQLRREVLAKLALAVARRNTEAALPLLAEVRELVDGPLDFWHDRFTLRLFEKLEQALGEPAAPQTTLPSSHRLNWSQRVPPPVMLELARHGRHAELARRLAHADHPIASLVSIFKADSSLPPQPLLTLAEGFVAKTDSRQDREDFLSLRKAVAATSGAPEADEEPLEALIAAGEIERARELAERSGEHAELALRLAAAGMVAQAEAEAERIANPSARLDCLLEIASRIALDAPDEARRLTKRAMHASRWSEPPEALGELATTLADLDVRLAEKLAVAAVEAGYSASDEQGQGILCRLVYAQERFDLARKLLFGRYGWRQGALAGLVAHELVSEGERHDQAQARIAAVLAEAPDRARLSILATIATELLDAPHRAQLVRRLLAEAVTGAAQLEPLPAIKVLFQCCGAYASIDKSTSWTLLERIEADAELLAEGVERARITAEIVSTRRELGEDLDAWQAAEGLSALERAHLFSHLAKLCLSKGDPDGLRLASSCVHCCRDLDSPKRSEILSPLAERLAAHDSVRAGEVAEAAQWLDEDWSPIVGTAYALWISGHRRDCAEMLSGIPSDFYLQDEFAGAAEALWRAGRWKEAREAIAEIENRGGRERTSQRLAKFLAANHRWEEAAEILADIPLPGATSKIFAAKVALHTGAADQNRAELEANARRAVAEALETPEWTSAFGLLGEIDPAAAIGLGRHLAAEAAVTAEAAQETAA